MEWPGDNKNHGSMIDIFSTNCQIALVNARFYKDMVGNIKAGYIAECEFHKTKSDEAIDIHIEPVDLVDLAKYTLSEKVEGENERR